MKNPAITRIVAALSWVMAVDLPDNLIDSPAYGPQEQADVRAILARVRELDKARCDPKANHWNLAREEFIERVLDEAGAVLPNPANMKLSEHTYYTAEKLTEGQWKRQAIEETSYEEVEKRIARVVGSGESQWRIVSIAEIETVVRSLPCKAFEIEI